MEALEAYKTMPEFHKSNLKSYYIYDGIYSAFPDISDEDSHFIHSICLKIINENINPFSISHYLTDHYTRGNLTKNDLKNATSREICDAVYFNSLDYFSSLEIDETAKYL